MVLRLLLLSAAIANSPDPSVIKERIPQLKEKCEKDNDAIACGDLGALHLLGNGVARDETKAVEFYEKACRFGQAFRCLRVGLLVLNGKGASASAVKAAELFGIGCKLLDTESCIHYYAVTHGTKVTLDGEVKPLPPNLEAPKPLPSLMQDAMKTLTLNCEKNVAKACGNVGGFYEQGEAEGQNLEKALTFFLKACELGEAERCGRAGRYYANGVGAGKDLQKAAKLFDRFCELKNMVACPLAHRARAGMAVELAVPPAVASVGTKEEMKTLSYREPEKKAELSPPKFPLWTQEMPDAYIDPAGQSSELAELIRSCNIGHARSCGNAGGLLLDEEGKPKSQPSLVRRLFEKACFYGRAQRCEDLAKFYTNGWGVEKSTERAKAAHAQACKLGLKGACQSGN